MIYSNPTIPDFKAYFFRDFPYGSSLDTVTDQDLMNAFALTDSQINPCIFANQEGFTQGFLYLAAHYLVTNLRNSSQGIVGQFDWLVNSKGVGSVSEGLSIPDRILANPEFAFLSKTTYGALYLSLILPSITGQIFVVLGDTLP